MFVMKGKASNTKVVFHERERLKREIEEDHPVFIIMYL